MSNNFVNFDDVTVGMVLRYGMGRGTGLLPECCDGGVMELEPGAGWVCSDCACSIKVDAVGLVIEAPVTVCRGH